MARLLIINCTPEALLHRIAALGGRPYAALFLDSIGQHVPDGRALDHFVLNVADGEGLPQGVQLGDFDGVWISGSPFNVYRPDQPTVREQIELARAIWQAGIPRSACAGAAAHGGGAGRHGSTQSARARSVARRICLTEAGRSHALFQGKEGAFDALCSHEDEVATLPSGATVLASNATSAIQAAAISDGRKAFWGVQYHPEFDFAAVAAIIELRAQRHLDEGLARSGEEVAAIVSDFRDLAREPGRKDLAWRYGVGADVLDPTARTAEFGNWLRTAVLPAAARR